jgi:3-oxoacyl-[acyl-carrier-protein] synthase-1
MKARDDGPCVIGLGARTPVGRSMNASAAAVRAGLPRLAEHPHYTEPDDSRPVIVARASWLDVERVGNPRLSALAVPAAREALAGVAPRALRVWLAGPSARPGRPEDMDSRLPGRLRLGLGKLGFDVTVAELVAEDHGGGLAALARADAELRAGRVDLALVGGFDSFLEFATLDWLAEERRLLTARNPWGFVPGEAAGFVLLAAPSYVERHRPRVLGRLVSVALAREQPIGPNVVLTGAALTEAVHAALGALPPDVRIAERYCDLNGEPWRADEYAFVTVRTAERVERPRAFVSPVGSWGDCGAATGPLLVGLALAAAERGFAAGPHALLTTSAAGGLRGAAVVRAEPAPAAGLVWA